MNFEMSNGNDQMSELLARAREQSQALAERRAGVTPLPTLVRPDRSAARGAWLSALQTRFAVGGLTAAVLLASGVTWALVSRSSEPRFDMKAAAVSPLRGWGHGHSPLRGGGHGESLLRRAASIGPAPVRAARRAAPSFKAPVVEKSVLAFRAVKRKPVLRGMTAATKAKVTLAAEAKANNKSKGSGVVRFGEQPQGDVIIVRPKTKHGPLWTKESFEKVIRMRYRSY